jgi:hypothetical protein
MSEPQQMAGKLKDALGGLFKTKTRQIPGLIGDGTTESRVIVTGATQRVWFRPDPYPNALWQPIHLSSDVPLLHGMAAIVEFNESDGEWYVQQIDRKKYAEQEDLELRYLPAHAAQHSISEDSISNDPVWVYRRAMPMLRGSPPGDASLRVFIQSGDLPFTGNPYFAGSFTADLTGSLPAAGNQVWLTISITSAAAIDINVGSEFAEGLSGINAPPDADIGNVPICHVLLSDDTTTLSESEIWDARRTIGVFADPVLFANPTAEVGLTAVNGSAVTAMRSDAAPALDQGIIPTWTGIHTHQADILMDSADIDLDGNLLIIDADGDTYIREGVADDQIYIYVAGVLTGVWWTGGLLMAPSKQISLEGNADALELDADRDTTISAPTDDQIDIEIAGADQIVLGASEMAFNEQGADIDFRVEGVGTTHALFVQGSDGFVGIGESSPDNVLHVTDTGIPVKCERTSALTSSGAAAFILQHTTSGDMADGFGSNTNYVIRDDAAVDNTITVISNTRDGADNSGRMQFFTNNAGSLTAKVTIKAGGNVGIGAAAPGSLLELNLATEDLEIVDAGSAGATEQDWIEVQVGGVTGYIRVYAAV